MPAKATKVLAPEKKFDIQENIVANPFATVCLVQRGKTVLLAITKHTYIHFGEVVGLKYQQDNACSKC